MFKSDIGRIQTNNVRNMTLAADALETFLPLAEDAEPPEKTLRANRRRAVPFSNRDIHHPLVQRLRSTGPLSEIAEVAIRGLPVELSRISAKSDIVTTQEPADSAFFIIDGMAASYRLDNAGKRQILSLHVRGDMPDLLTLQLPSADAAISAVGECFIARVRHRHVRELCRSHAEICDGLWRLSLVDAVVVREWVCNLGSRDGLERLAHLLCEIVVRKEEVGVGSRRSCPIEFNQQDLADATGMSAVHANRTIQELRRRSLIRLSQRSLTVLDWQGLASLADFNPDYLFLRAP